MSNLNLAKRNFDEEHYKQDLCHAPWHVGEIFDTVDGKVGFCKVLMASIVDKHLPVKKIRVRPQDVPCMSHEWKNAIRAARKHQKKQTRENWEKM